MLMYSKGGCHVADHKYTTNIIFCQYRKQPSSLTWSSVDSHLALAAVKLKIECKVGAFEL